MLHLLAELLEQQSEFRFTLSLSGVVLEQFKAFAPELLLHPQNHVQTGRVEILGETYYHSWLDCMTKQVAAQVQQHTALIKQLFDVTEFSYLSLFTPTELPNWWMSLVLRPC